MKDSQIATPNGSGSNHAGGAAENFQLLKEQLEVLIETEYKRMIGQVPASLVTPVRQAPRSY